MFPGSRAGNRGLIELGRVGPPKVNTVTQPVTTLDNLSPRYPSASPHTYIIIIISDCFITNIFPRLSSWSTQDTEIFRSLSANNDLTRQLF